MKPAARVSIGLCAAGVWLAGCGSSSSSPADGGGIADATQDISPGDGAQSDAPFDAGAESCEPGCDATADASPTCGFPSILDGFAPARILYVAPGGSDVNDGTSAATAWATLAHGGALKPGDEVRVATGTYPCPVLGPIAGASGSPVHFVASDGARTAKLDCSAGGMFLTNLQYVAFDGFEITGAAAGSHCINLNSGGGPPYANLSEHDLFIHDYIHACGLSALKVSQAFEIDLVQSELASNTAAGNPLVDYVAVHDSHFVQNLVHDGVDVGLQMKGGAYNCVIDANVIYNVGSNAINMGQSTGTAFFLPGYGDWEASHSVVANNVIYGTIAQGAIAVWGCDQCVVAHNTVWATSAAEFVRGLSSTNSVDAGIDDTDLVLEDNIFAAQNLPIALNITAANGIGLVQGYNLYYSTAGSVGKNYSDTPIGGSGNLVDTDPRFVSAAPPLDLALAPGSPAIGVATAVGAVPGTVDGGCGSNANLGAY